MLVLTRKAGESVCIGNDIRVRVVSFSRGSVRLAIDAPSEVAVHREEVLERIAEENRMAAQASGEAAEALRGLDRGLEEDR